MDKYFEKMRFVFFENAKGEADVIVVSNNTVNDVSNLIDKSNYFFRLSFGGMVRTLTEYYTTEKEHDYNCCIKTDDFEKYSMLKLFSFGEHKKQISDCICRIAHYAIYGQLVDDEEKIRAFDKAMDTNFGEAWDCIEKMLKEAVL